MQHLFFLFGLALSCPIACGTKNPRCGAIGGTATATVSKTSSTAPVLTEFGGLLLFRMEKKSVILSYTNVESVVQHARDRECTLNRYECRWIMYTKDGKVVVILHSNGDALEDADVRVYINERRRLITLWEPPDNTFQWKVLVETDSKKTKRTQ